MKSVEVHFISGVTLPLTSVVSATRMVARLSNARCMFNSCWLELTSLKMANHGPQKLRHNPVAWSVTVCATLLWQLALQNAIAKCRKLDSARRICRYRPVRISWHATRCTYRLLFQEPLGIMIPAESPGVRYPLAAIDAALLW